MKYIMQYKDLKIQFRAVYYAESNHVLEYRVDPNQNLTYYKEYSFLGIHWKIKKKYKTDWIQPEHYWNHCTAKYYDENDSFNFGPYFIENQKELDWYKNNFKTIGEFLKYHIEYSNKEYEEWKIDRINYLKSKETIY